MKKINKIVVVGLGRQALHQISLLNRFRPDIKIPYLIDDSIAAYYRFLDKFNNKFETSFSTSISDAIKFSNPDLVYVSTLADSHAEIAIELIKCGYKKSIIIEKPISNSLLKANSLKDKILESKWEGDIYIGFYRRSNELLKEVKKIILSKNLGTLNKINYNRTVELSTKGIHWIDLANWFINEKKLTASSELFWDRPPGKRGAKILDPICNLKVTYANEVEFNIIPATNPNKDKRIELGFSKGNIVINDNEDKAKIYFENEEREINMPRSKEKSFLNFLNSIEERDPNLPKISEGIDALETMFAAHMSDKLNKNISFPINTNDAKFSLSIG